MLGQGSSSSSPSLSTPSIPRIPPARRDLLSTSRTSSTCKRQSPLSLSNSSRQLSAISHQPPSKRQSLSSLPCKTQPRSAFSHQIPSPSPSQPPAPLPSLSQPPEPPPSLSQPPEPPVLSLNSKDITSFLEPQGDKVRKPCIVPGCQALIAPSMWKTHLEGGHVRGAYAVAMSHKASHSKKCNPLQNPSLSTVPRSTPDAVSDAIPSLSDVYVVGWPLGDLWKLAVSRATSSTHVHQKEVPVRKKLTSAISLAQDGLYGKACQTLTSSGVAPNNPTTWNLLVSKHPSCTCPSVPDTPHTDFKLPSTFNLMAILRSFPKLTAAGPSGLRIQHLIDAAEVPLQTPVLHSLRAVIDLLVSGRASAEVAVFLAGGNLTALNKPAPGDIRPIAVGESIRRLTGKCLCVALKEKAASFFEPSQFGVACPNGAEKVTHGLRACMDKHWFDDDFGVLKIDMKNAFNLVSRQALLSECAKHFPELFPWGLKNVAGLWSQLEEVGLIDPQAIDVFNCLVASSDVISVENLLSSCSVHQKAHSEKLDDRQFNLLLNCSSVADRARLLSVSSPFAASWLSVIPSEGLGLHLTAPIFQVALKWWLGLDTSGGSQCSLCPGSVLDHLSHHAVTCKRGGDVVTRHNRLRDCIVDVCRRAHIGVQVEVGNNLTPSHSKTRPADILIPNWVMGRTAALDVSVTSPLNPQTLLEAGVTATAAALTTEERKHDENDPKCSELGWVCIPVVAESYGAWGREATLLFSTIASRIATLSNKPKSVTLIDIYGRLNLQLVRANATSILARLMPPSY
eukprot:Em0017g530a